MELFEDDFFYYDEETVKLDPFEVLPKEISILIISKCSYLILWTVSQVSKRWLQISEDETLYKIYCEKSNIIHLHTSEITWKLTFIEWAYNRKCWKKLNPSSLDDKNATESFSFKPVVCGQYIIGIDSHSQFIYSTQTNSYLARESSITEETFFSLSPHNLVIRETPILFQSNFQVEILSVPSFKIVRNLSSVETHSLWYQATHNYLFQRTQSGMKIWSLKTFDLILCTSSQLVISSDCSDRYIEVVNSMTLSLVDLFSFDTRTVNLSSPVKFLTLVQDLIFFQESDTVTYYNINTKETILMENAIGYCLSQSNPSQLVTLHNQVNQYHEIRVSRIESSKLIQMSSHRIPSIFALNWITMRDNIVFVSCENGNSGIYVLLDQNLMIDGCCKPFYFCQNFLILQKIQFFSQVFNYYSFKYLPKTNNKRKLRVLTLPDSSTNFQDSSDSKSKKKRLIED